MALNYTNKLLKTFLKPKNIGEIKNPDGSAEIGNPVCGDMLKFTIKVKDGKIQDAKFLSFGCAANIATASVLTEKVKGLTLKEAKNFDFKKIIKNLGSMPKQKVHCSVLAVQGLKKAIENYEKKVK
ncbi:MAG: iron-sulfur cluster assembly scaffold protein [Candidatus Peregrinibacteria bacterium]